MATSSRAPRNTCPSCGQRVRPQPDGSILCASCGGPTQKLSVDRPREDGHWRVVSSAADLEEPRARDLAAAWVLWSDGVPIDFLARNLLLVRPGGPTLDEFLEGTGEIDPDTMCRAHARARTEVADAVVSWVARGADVLESRGRVVVRPGDLRESIGPYRVVCVLGRGGMGEVDLAYKPGLDRDLAIKTIRLSGDPDPTFVERFGREAQVLGRLSHPNVVSIVDVEVGGPEPYLVMDYVPGVDLGQRMRTGIEHAEAIRILEKMARALDHAHRQGVFHRDVKPANVLVDLDGEPYLADFGLAAVADHRKRLTGTHDIMGTPQYMPPEVLKGGMSKYTARSDLYSLGVILYEVLTGRLPFAARDMQRLFREIQVGASERPRDVDPSIPAELEELCLAAMSVDPARRPASGREFAERLETARVTTTVPRRRSPATSGRSSRRTAVAVALGGLLVVAGIGIGISVGRPGKGGQAPASPEAAPETSPPLVRDPPLPVARVPFEWTRIETPGRRPNHRYAHAIDPAGTPMAFAGGVTSPFDSMLWVLGPIEGGEARWTEPSRPPHRIEALLLHAPDREGWFLLGGREAPGELSFAGKDGEWRRETIEHARNPSGDLRSGFYDAERGRIVSVERVGEGFDVWALEPGSEGWTWRRIASFQRPITRDNHLAWDGARRRAYLLSPSRRDGQDVDCDFLAIDFSRPGTPRLSVLVDDFPMLPMHRVFIRAGRGCLAFSLFRVAERTPTVYGAIVDGEQETLSFTEFPAIDADILDQDALWYDERNDALVAAVTERSSAPRLELWSCPLGSLRD